MPGDEGEVKKKGCPFSTAEMGDECGDWCGVRVEGLERCAFVVIAEELFQAREDRYARGE